MSAIALRNDFLVLDLFILGLKPQHMEDPRLGGKIGAAGASLCHSHSNARSQPQLQPTPQLRVTPDP